MSSKRNLNCKRKRVANVTFDVGGQEDICNIATANIGDVRLDCDTDFDFDQEELEELQSQNFTRTKFQVEECVRHRPFERYKRNSNAVETRPTTLALTLEQVIDAYDSTQYLSSESEKWMNRFKVCVGYTSTESFIDSLDINPCSSVDHFNSELLNFTNATLFAKHAKEVVNGKEMQLLEYEFEYGFLLFVVVCTDGTMVKHAYLRKKKYTF